MVILALLGLIVFVALIYGPQFWIKRIMQAHATELPGMPGTGGDLARHLLDDAGLNNVKVEITADGRDHYSTDDKAVRLSEANFNGKSITAVAVAAHEVAHAVQDRDGYMPLMMRQRLVKKTIIVERFGSIILMATPLVFALVKSPAVLLLELAAALGILASTIVIHVVTLPTEFDASFKKALPVLENYLPQDKITGARSVLRAAAFTYVAGALVSLLNVARWLRLLRF
jgi:Zn-dependent membrane protease YugP